MRCILKNRTIFLTDIKVTSGIYKIECVITGAVYIGYTVDMYQRYRTYERVRCSDTGVTESLYQYGLENHTFEIIHVVERSNFLNKMDFVLELDRLEVEYIKKYNSYYKDNDKGLNRTRGGGVKIGCPTKAERLLKLKSEQNG